MNERNVAGRGNRVSRRRIVKAPVAFSCDSAQWGVLQSVAVVAECHPEFPLVWEGLLESVQRPV